MGENKIEAEYNEINSKNGWMKTFQVIDFQHFLYYPYRNYYQFNVKCSSKGRSTYVFYSLCVCHSLRNGKKIYLTAIWLIVNFSIQL